MRRTLLGMSQERLGDAIGLTFQQVQKYERGSNRISAGTLFRLGQVLDVPVSFFFDNYEDSQGASHPTRTGDGSLHGDGVISRRDARLLRLWRAAPAAVADELLALLASLSPHIPETGETADGAMDGKADGKTASPVRKAKPMAADAEPARKSRRRHGAIWDPSDIYRSSKATTRS